jgi:DNA mismatch repair protein MutL
MSSIKILPADVVARIAAGEVVERPAAVVKELVENSLDADSRRIAIDLINGGRDLIRVTDDGEGIARAEVALAFERHATSKLQSDNDLWAVRTMGFRGEALPSIAAVSNVRVVTARREQPLGCQVTVCGGKVLKVEDAASAPGTTVEVADLFFNTPARKKFLKSVPTELSHICHVVQQAALAWPGIRFALRHNEHPVLDYPPARSLSERVHQVYGERVMDQMVPVRRRDAGLSVDGFTLSPLHARAGRSPQDLLVNRRAVRNATVTHAAAEAYGTFLVRGRQPLFVLSLTVEPERLDINVHPTKREIRFSDAEAIHRFIFTAMRDAIGSQPDASPVTRHASPVTASPPSVSGHSLPVTDPAPFATRRSSPVIGAGDAVQEFIPGYATENTADVRPLGQVHRTFLVAQVGPELHVVDQHTAHERVLFARLCRAWTDRRIVAQPLLIPETIELPAHSAALLQRYLPQLAELGLEIEPFGGHAFLVRTVPAILGRLEQGGLVADLLDDLAQWNSVESLEQRVRPLMASLACHGAVRAGRAMELPEIRRLIEEWAAEGYPTTCPHGRRIALRFTEDELGRIFGRA